MTTAPITDAQIYVMIAWTIIVRLAMKQTF